MNPIKINLNLIYILLLLIFILVSDECSEKCPRPLIYEELGCKAIYGSNGCCPKRYHCTNFATLDKSRCHLNGNSFAVGEILPRNLITDGSKCVESCFCSRYRNEPAKFSCANNECGISNIRVPGCTNVYGDLNECCSTSTICEDEEKETLATCWMDGQTFTEGEKMYPALNSCYECLCQNDFDNTTIVQNQHCQKINCGISLDKSHIQRGCLPIYESKSIACCPIAWKCPENEKFIVKRSVEDDEESSSLSSNIFVVTPEASSNYAQSVISEEQSLIDDSTDVTTELSSTATAQDIKPSLLNFLVPPSPTNASSKQNETTKEKTESDVLDLDDFIANVLKRTTEAPEIIPIVELSSTTVSPLSSEYTSTELAPQGKSIQEKLSPTEEVTSATTQSPTTTITITEKSTSESTSESSLQATTESTTVSTSSEPTTISSTASIALSDSLAITESTIEATIIPEINLESVTEITSEYTNFTISFQQGPTPRATDEEEKRQPRKRSISDKTAIPYVLKAMKQTGSTECIFSGIPYKAGEKIKTDDDCLKCFCEFPPIGQCFQKDNCYQ
ncbi:unnamed protein product [Diamesa serratosioi]